MATRDASLPANQMQLYPSFGREYPPSLQGILDNAFDGGHFIRRHTPRDTSRGSRKSSTKFTFIVISSMALVFLFLLPQSSSVRVQIYRPLKATPFTSSETEDGILKSLRVIPHKHFFHPPSQHHNIIE